MKRTQRILDPIHGLIIFRKENEIDELAWQLVNTREFQRLRRIKQLGFSDLVFPGATHTRFTHCLGVFHVARMLLDVINRQTGDFDPVRAQIAACAALLHDLGHGPFSHTFEQVEKAREVPKKHEQWAADLIKGDTEVHAVLDRYDSSLADAVAELLTQREPTDIYSAVVSSQFDADRLDYLRRDRYMTGAGSGGFDFNWLLDCLEVGKITVGGGGDEDFVEVDGLYLNYKGLQAAEGYLLARYHLYSQVYFHKTTRGAEAMLRALLTYVADKIKNGDVKKTGLDANHPLTLYFSSSEDNPEDNLKNYFSLDDSVISESLGAMESAPDDVIAELASRLVHRRLYKCFDAGVMSKNAGGDSLSRFRMRLHENQAALGLEKGTTLLSDQAKISAYGTYEFEEPGALQKVLISEQDRPDTKEDIGERSQIVKAIPLETLFRIYVPDAEAVERLNFLWKEVTP